MAWGLWALLWAVLSVPARAQTPPGRLPFIPYAEDKGFGLWSVRALAQDASGSLWVGNEHGLYRYDGHRFQPVEAAKPVFNTVYHLGVDEAGGVWCATGSDLLRWHEGRWTEPGPLPSGGVRRMAADPAGRLWLTAAAEGLLRAGPDGRITPEPGWPGGEAHGLWASSPEALYVGGLGVVHVRDARGWRTLGGPDWGLPRAPVDLVARDGGGRLWLGVEGRLWRWDDATRTLVERTSGVEGRPLLGALLDGKGTLWLSGAAGLFQVEPGGEPRRVTGMPFRLARTLLEDREGSLWVGGAGLHRLAGRGLWRAHGLAEGLPDAMLWTLFRDGTGRLWAGSEEGLSRATATGWEKETAVPPVPVRSIVPAPEGALWLGGATAGVLHYDPRSHQVRVMALPAAGRAPFVFALATDGAGDLWVATDQGAFRGEGRGAAARFVRVPLPVEGGVDHLADIRRDGQGRLWLAGGQGLYLEEQGRLRRWSTADGLRHDAVHALLARANGELCVAYRVNMGVSCFRYAGGALEAASHFDTRTGLSSDLAFLLGEDSAGRFWVGTGKGVDLLEAGRVVARFSTADGLPGNDCGLQAFWADDTGDVWIGTSSGLGQFLGRRYSGPPPPPRPVLTGARTPAGPRDLSGPWTLPWWQNDLDLHFAVPSFVGERDLERQTRLEGLETEWSTRDDLHVRYAALAPGDYTFEVRARHPAGEWGPVARLGFTLTPPWWQTWWWRSCVVLGVGGLGLLAARAWQQGLRRRNHRLQELVQERTRALREAQDQLVHLTRELTEQTMAGGFAHEMRNALTGAKMLLGQALGPGPDAPRGLCADTGEQLSRLYVWVRERASEEERRALRPLFQKAQHNEERLEVLLGDVDAALARALNTTRVLLDYARLGRETAGGGTVCLRTLMDAIVAESQGDFDTHGIQVRLDFAPDARVSGSEEHFYSLLKNLVLNARDALAQKQGVGPRLLHVTLERRPGEYELRVEDTGPGIPQALLPRVFEPFFSTKPETGTGLGLGVVRKLTLLYRGTVEVQSAVGQGTCFLLRFPSPAPPAEAHGGACERSASS
ncbi:hypothetical protein ASNO1_44370 [Corallococcus caeni]|uniref:histidine kinase n=1 Tax=Corallococcus caeni TaxID=3082388 RepID=A0ABQ6QW25_9BACT|nr:hypothetical protein ASNO1_44370 [Corallococcus sp. NO1]